jgi:glycyl-tRNA synthetase
VRAVLAARGDDPALAAATVTELQAALDEGEEGPIRTVMAALARPTRIVRGKASEAATAVDPALFELKEERQLWAAYEEAAAQLAAAGTPSVGQFVAVCGALVAPINAYFDKVFVMAEDAAVRGNRLAVLRDLAALPRGVVDLAQLPNF